MEELNTEGIRTGSAPGEKGQNTQSACTCKPIDFERRLTGVLGRFPGDKDRLIALLQSVQDEFGYLPPEAMVAIARHIGIHESRVYSVATFYNQFRFTPIGRHPVKVCLGTACHMAGGPLVLEAVERTLDIKVGGITPDGAYSIDRVACVGCCAIAPVVVIGHEVHPRMSSFKAEEVLVAHKGQAGGVVKDE